VRARDESQSGRDIGDIPPVFNQGRRDAAKRNFRYFCEAYFPDLFGLEWSDDHLKVINRIETAVLHGGLFAMAMPRGSGKTTLSEVACLWAAVYGHRQFICLVGSDEGSAATMLESLKTALEGNDHLDDDFPEVAMPIRELEGIANRCKGQLCNGDRTHISWTAKEIVLPTVHGSKASGIIVKVAGITGRIRGMKFVRADGKSVRPDLVIIDDPQTDESARSASQCATRESILAGAILNLAGPGQKIAGIMPCTVIQPDDMADRLLNRERHPDWHGIRTQMVYAFPTNERPWEEYASIRAEDLQTGGDGSKATEFYRQNREAMDQGAEVAWPQRFNHDEISALQHAMNLKLRDEAAFFSEYQNEPILDQSGDVIHLTPEEIMGKLSRRARGVVPTPVEFLTMFVDVHDSLLYWMICGWSAQFDGFIVDYGTTPEQTASYFTMRQATRTMKSLAPNAGTEGVIYAGLDAVVNAKAEREWMREDGTPMRLQRINIDAGYKTTTVHQLCRQSQHAAVLWPAKGEGINAGRKPIGEYDRARAFVGANWWIPKTRTQILRTVHADVNWWKSFVRDRFATAMGDRGCLSVFGDKPYEHKLLADHLTSESAVKTEGHGRVVEEWKLPPGRDNHWLDCLVGCAIGASMLGSKLYVPEAPGGPVVRKRVKLSEIQARKRGEHGR